MYYSNRRETGRYRFSGSGSRAVGGPLYFSYSSPLVLEGVYSWRTGYSKVSDPPITPPTRQVFDGFGIKTPTGKGNLVDKLSERKAYLEEVMRTAFPAETATGSTSVDRASTTDSGHLFASHKTVRKPWIAHYKFYSSPTVHYDGNLVGSVGQGLANPSPYSFGFPNENKVNALGVTPQNRQGTANRYFAATAPDRQVGSLAVTILELLRGDIPSLLKNFQKMMAGMQSIRKTLGSDYLNIAFGWTPLIQEYANIIKVGMTLERAIYYESYRRKRAWEGPSLRQSDLITNVSLNSSSLVYGQSTLPEQGDFVPPSGGYGAVYSATSVRVVHEDYRFTSKYTGLAKAPRRAESFSEIALEVITRMGLVDDPTLLWELTPWSWLVDWFSTMGSSIANASIYSPSKGKYDVDYAYLTTKYSDSTTGSLLRLNSGLAAQSKISVLQPTSFVGSVTKWRDRATPFGFGTQLGSITASQFAILVALGFAKHR